MVPSRLDVEPSKPAPLAFLLTWTTYGTWLPGDPRGWVEKGRGQRRPDVRQHEGASQSMSETACTLDLEQRRIVECTIRAHCEIRGWRLWAINCRTNHVHVVVTANADPAEVLRQLKAWTARRLRQHGETTRQKWWTERGSKRWINDEAGLEAAIHYVLHAQ